MGLDVSHDCWTGGYTSFMRWRAKLAQVAGLPPLELMEGFYEKGSWRDPIKPECVSVADALPIQWACLKRDVLHVLLSHSDSDGTIEARRCGPLADRLEALLPLLPEGDGGGHIGNWRAKTTAFIEGLRYAASRKRSGFILLRERMGRMRKQHLPANSTAPGSRVIDYEELARAIRRKAGGRRQAACALEVGISASTFSRLARAVTMARVERPTIESETVVRVCRWLDVPLEAFTGVGQPPKINHTPDVIDYLLMRDESLRREDAVRLSGMMRAAYDGVARKEQG